ncbi:DUF6894 family protein [Methylobacterium thuringiense]|uniref:DUF6894 family protein n=1 Tax=Methylobacterium thuringiense TaxID=1003091 RepID=UPI0011CCDC4A|nr:hypothetical protein FV217_10060 [Methylobacterium sp. WL9]
MPRYFFDTNDGLDFRDHIGCEFRDQAALRRGALKAITGLLAAGSEKCDSYSVVLQVRDEQDETIFVIRSVCQIDIQDKF